MIGTLYDMQAGAVTQSVHYRSKLAKTRELFIASTLDEEHWHPYSLEVADGLSNRLRHRIGNTYRATPLTSGQPSYAIASDTT